MADLNPGSARDAAVPAALASPSSPTVPDDLVAFVELFFFAYRDFTGEADAVLQRFELGRAHHRVLHFVNRHPGLRVIDLLDILKITKQSLARVLKTLIDGGFIEQRAGESDRRERLLFTSPKGRALAERLVGLQVARVGQALAAAGPEGADSVRRFLAAMVSHADREAIEAMLKAAARPRG
jgi:DNA-binding MarR family transcriptional regulator